MSNRKQLNVMCWIYIFSETQKFFSFSLLLFVPTNFEVRSLNFPTEYFNCWSNNFTRSKPEIGSRSYHSFSVDALDREMVKACWNWAEAMPSIAARTSETSQRSTVAHWFFLPFIRWHLFIHLVISTPMPRETLVRLPHSLPQSRSFSRPRPSRPSFFYLFIFSKQNGGG